MILTRRNVLGGLPALGIGVFMAGPAFAEDPRMTERGLGDPKAKVRVEEWYSMTCIHCARFAHDVFPEVKEKLIDTGKIYYVFKDFPLDRVALMATMVARALPVERYEPFVLALLASQDRWAFAQNVDPQAQIRMRAALAGMPGDVFDKTINDDGLRQAIMNEQSRGADAYHIDSTPTFRFNTVQVSGEIDYATFAENVAKAAA
jgi:protein-disulfide isomerase